MCNHYLQKIKKLEKKLRLAGELVQEEKWVLFPQVLVYLFVHVHTCRCSKHFTYNNNYVIAVCVNNYRYAEGAEKYLSLLETDDDISPFVLRIRSNLCHCYSKVLGACCVLLVVLAANTRCTCIVINGGPCKNKLFRAQFWGLVYVHAGRAGSLSLALANLWPVSMQ